MVKSVVTGLSLNHYFTQSDKVRDTSIEGLLMKMYEHDFVEPQLQHCDNKMNINYDKLSRNDRRFLDLMDQKAVKVDGHYELPLPLKDEDIRLPNNRAVAMKRLESLRRKFEKDDRFFKEHKNFMEKLMVKRYARKCDGKGPDDKTWFVPHQGVLNHNKGKVRVVFDCSSQYRGTSINENLLSGSDLTNKFVQVLIRFRVGPVEFMADIQAMFYQVKVP